MSSDGKGSLREFIACLVRGIVDEPDVVRVTETERAGLTTYEITVAPPDVAKVIGRHGRVVTALRNAARGAALKSGRRVTVEILD
jgi:hypothetical protein